MWTPVSDSEKTFQSTPSGGKATVGVQFGWSRSAVSIHAFRGEGDTIAARAATTDRQFQSTPSGGKATSRNGQIRQDNPGFNPRLPGGRRLLPTRGAVGLVCFNPRLPGGRRPPSPTAKQRRGKRFNPRLPGGRRPTRGLSFGVCSTRFNPRLPGGRRLITSSKGTEPEMFQSTPSGGKATSV